MPEHHSDYQEAMKDSGRKYENETVVLFISFLMLIVFGMEGSMLQTAMRWVGVPSNFPFIWAVLGKEESPWADDQSLFLTIQYGLTLSIPFWMTFLSLMAGMQFFINALLPLPEPRNWLLNYMATAWGTITFLVLAFHVIGATKLGVTDWSFDTGMAGLSTMSIGSAVTFIALYVLMIICVHLSLLLCCSKKTMKK